MYNYKLPYNLKASAFSVANNFWQRHNTAKNLNWNLSGFWWRTIYTYYVMFPFIFLFLHFPFFLYLFFSFSLLFLSPFFSSSSLFYESFLWKILIRKNVIERTNILFHIMSCFLSYLFSFLFSFLFLHFFQIISFLFLRFFLSFRFFLFL